MQTHWTNKHNMIKITYAILTHNEGRCIQDLLRQIKKHKDPYDEIVVVDDYSDDDVTRAILKEWDYENDISLYYRKLNGDFAAQKNYLISRCSKDTHWIVNIDADELLNENLIKNIKTILIENDQIEAYWVPRENKVTGITQEHINAWRWELDSKNRINYPDYQMRIFKYAPDRIKWENKVHEKLTGYKTFAAIPTDAGLDIIHIKDIKKQEQQNNFYNTLG